MSHAYWRTVFSNTGGGAGATTVAELAFYDGGSSLIAATGGTPSASSTVGGTSAANAFDTNTATIWASTAAATPSSHEWLQYQFGSAVDVHSIAITIRGDSHIEQAPIDIALQYSDDGSAFTTLYQWLGVDWFTLGQTQTLTAVNAAPASLVVAYRLLITATGGFVGSTSLAEWVLLDGGAVAIPTGKFAAPSSGIATNEATAGAAAFDGDVNTYWSSGGTPSGGSPEWVSYQFGSSVFVGSFSIRARNDGNYTQTPGSFSLQKSPDGSTWTTLQSYTAATWTAASQVQTFGAPSAGSFRKTRSPMGTRIGSRQRNS